MQKIKVAYFGTPDFAVPSLEMLHNHPQVEIVAVVSMPDRPAGRGQKLQAPPVAEFAKNNGLTLIQTENINKESDWVEHMSALKVDAFVVLAFAQFLGSKLLALPKLGCFNIHTSLLPKYRGAAPIQHALLHGDPSTGVSIQRMVKKMDAGNIVAEMPIEIGAHETGGQLYTRLKFASALTLNDFITRLIANDFQEREQSEDHISFAPPLKKEDGHLNFTEQTATQIERRVRALAPWPGTFTFFNKKRLKVLEVELSTLKLKPGQVDTSQAYLIVGTLEGSIRLRHIQPEGKRPCDDRQFINGLKSQNISEYNLS